MSGGEGGGGRRFSRFQEPIIEEDSEYYGKKVRGLFLAAGLTMIISLPVLREGTFVSRYADIFIFVAFFWILLVGILGALGRRAMTVDIVSSAIGFIFFEYGAILNYTAGVGATNEYNLVFFIAQALAIIFFLALFYGIRALKALIQERSEE